MTCRKEKHLIIIFPEFIWFLTVEILIYKELIFFIGLFSYRLILL